jgi:signal transduction histidine kinase
VSGSDCVAQPNSVISVFHEIRLPLNTALLAVQSLEHEGATTKLDLEHAGMVRGLTGSLGMMERVCRSDFPRRRHGADQAGFERCHVVHENGDGEGGFAISLLVQQLANSIQFPQSRKPFDLHKSLQIVALPYRTQAQLAGLDLVLRLDQNIDKLEGSLLGDELRLRQITTFVPQLRQSSYGRRNLLSNAIKFTQSGSVCLATRLLSVGSEPLCSLPPTSESSETSDLEDGQKGMEEQHRGQRRRAVIRFEVHDTGIGLDKQLVAK